jgi:hypothetical protein
MKRLAPRFIVTLALAGLLAAVSYAKDPANGQPSEKTTPKSKAAGTPAKPRVFRQVGTGAVITPEPGMATKKYKDCKYDEKGRITNAPCTGTQKDDKGVTWWP